MRTTIAALALLAAMPALAQDRIEVVTFEYGGPVDGHRVLTQNFQTICTDPLADPTTMRLLCQHDEKMRDKVFWETHDLDQLDYLPKIAPTGNGVLLGWAVISDGKEVCSNPMVHVTQIRCPAEDWDHRTSAGDPGGEIRMHTPNIIEIIEPKIIR
jgi:hypothetical protein